MPKPTRKHKTKKRTRRSKPRASVRADKARKASPRLKVKAGKGVRRAAKKLGKAARKPFFGGLTKQIAKGLKVVREFVTTPTSNADKEKRLAKLGVVPYKAKRKRTPAQRRRIENLYTDFAEFAGRGRDKFAIITGASAETVEAARLSGMATWEQKYTTTKKVKGKRVTVTHWKRYIFVHKAREQETVRMARFMGERVIARTYYGKRERIFMGGAGVFDRVVAKLQKKPLPQGQMITGAFFGGPSFHRAIYDNVGDFLNYLNNSFVPHLAKGVKPTKRNIARAKAALIRNIAVVSIDGQAGDEGEEE